MCGNMKYVDFNLDVFKYMTSTVFLFRGAVTPQLFGQFLIEPCSVSSSCWFGVVGKPIQTLVNLKTGSPFASKCTRVRFNIGENAVRPKYRESTEPPHLLSVYQGQHMMIPLSHQGPRNRLARLICRLKRPTTRCFLIWSHRSPSCKETPKLEIQRPHKCGVAPVFLRSASVGDAQ